jgi:hypothetical protein
VVACTRGPTQPWAPAYGTAVIRSLLSVRGGRNRDSHYATSFFTSDNTAGGGSAVLAAVALTTFGQEPPYGTEQLDFERTTPLQRDGETGKIDADDPWLGNAWHANAMTARLAAGLRSIPGPKNPADSDGR